MELDASHQQLKHQLMACFDRASRSVDATHKKTREIHAIMDEEEDSRLLRLTQRINGARIKETESPPLPIEGETDEEEAKVLSDDLE